MLKNVHVMRPARPTELVLFIAGERESRSVSARGAVIMLKMIPVREGILCEIGSGGSHCGVVPRTATEYFIPEAPSAVTARVLRSDQGSSVRIQRPGRSSFRPQQVTSDVVRAGEWTALNLSSAQIEDAIIDVVSGELFVERFVATELGEPPLYADVHPPGEWGVKVKAQLGREGTLPIDKHATLLFFSASSGPASRVPIATTKSDPFGMFSSDLVPNGTYTLKLSSAMSDGALVNAFLTVGEVITVRFQAGLEISGRVRLTVGGSVPGGPRIRVMRQDEVRSASQRDLSDWANEVEGDLAGRFSLAIRGPGRYALRAEWGSGIGERTFEIEPGQKVVDLGDIALRRASSLRGTITGCSDGELRLAPSPIADEQPRALRFTELRKTRLAPDGTYFVEALPPGTWLVGGICAGRPADLIPPIVVIVAETDTIFDATAAKE